MSNLLLRYLLVRYLGYPGIYALVATAAWQFGSLIGNHVVSFLVSAWFGIGLGYLEQHCNLHPRPFNYSDWGKLVWIGILWPLVIQPR